MTAERPVGVPRSTGRQPPQQTRLDLGIDAGSFRLTGATDNAGAVVGPSGQLLAGLFVGEGDAGAGPYPVADPAGQLSSGGRLAVPPAGLPREVALRALAEGVPACPQCRPDSALGYLD
ncbi:DUF6233 domain-containing protein [Streptomyces tricolor]|uniref:DUF6233 domain-containing protein n=1 Tax=Streptomyces tricolor TaxID=68277 RepID=UPI0027E3DE4C|nr:DUF6233 domain-containing protein [Streptomyces tricolor]